MTTADVLTERFTRRDYLQLPEGFPAELIDGEFVREPSPTWGHQRLAAELWLRLAGVAGKDRVIQAPADVFLDEWNVLQPDVLVTAPDEPVRIDAKGGGLPLLVFEVLSPSTARRDRDVKTTIYLRAGVREVWLVDPAAGAIEIHTAGRAERRAGDGRAASAALPGFTLAWSDLAPPGA